MTVIDSPDAALEDLTRPEQYERSIRVLTEETDRLMDSVHRLDDDALRVPSLCEGWSRAHVLSHLARNADAMRNLVHWATTGEERAMYPSREARDADIEAGVGRSVAEIEADVEASADRFLDDLSRMPSNPARTLTLAPGRDIPTSDLALFRTTEITLHHLDLDVGYHLGQVDPALVERLLRDAARRLTLNGAPGFTVRTADGTTVQVSDGGPEIKGTAADLATWMTGRSAGATLTGDIPSSLPPWA